MSAEDDYLDTARLRVPPHSIEAEQSVLGCLLIDNASWDKVGDILTEKDFYRFEHQHIYLAIGGLINAGKMADIITVYEQIKSMGQLTERSIELTYLNELAQSVVSSRSARAYAEVVREKKMLRSMIAASDEIATACFNPQGRDATELMEEASLRISSLEKGLVDNVPEAIDKTVVRVIDRVNELHEQGPDAVLGWTTGFDGLNEILGGGLQGGKVYLLGGRPAMGKTALAIQVAGRLAVNEGLPVTFLSQEMGKMEFGQRLTANIGDISYARLKKGQPQDIEWGKLSEAVEKLGKSPLHIDCQSGLTQADISIKFRYIKGMLVGVLDYIQLCAGVEEGGRNRNQVLEAISRSIKQLAMKLNAAIIVLSALNRKVDERPHGRAIMSDFKDCGALEADADVIMSLFELRAKDSRGVRIMGLDVLKQRDGPIGSVPLDFHGEHMQWWESEFTMGELLKKERATTKGPL